MPEYATKKIAVIFVIKKSGKYLFQKRTHTGAEDGWYMMPGGHVDEGEKVVEAALRELKEELNIVVKAEDLVFKMVKAEKTHINFFFEVKQYSGKIINNEPEKHGDLRFLCATDERLHPCISGEIEALEQGVGFLENAYPS